MEHHHRRLPRSTGLLRVGRDRALLCVALSPGAPRLAASRSSEAVPRRLEYLGSSLCETFEAEVIL